MVAKAAPDEPCDKRTLEMRGAVTEQIPDLDDSSEEWRRLYFVRNIIRTLREIESGMQRLLSDHEFKVLLNSQESNVREDFAKHQHAMAAGIHTLREIRDDICGHVRESAVQAVLNELSDSDVHAVLETAPTQQRTFYKFVGEIVVQILVRGASETDKHKVFLEKIERIGDLIPGFVLIDRALHIYMKERNLLLQRT